jgi:hypothetical protein
MSEAIKEVEKFQAVVRKTELTEIHLIHLKSVEDETSPIKTDDVIDVGEKIIKIFPTGVNLTNLIEATVIVLKEVSKLYKLKPQHKIDLIVDILIYVIDNTDAGSLEALDPVLKQLIPGVIYNILQVEEGKIIIKPKTQHICARILSVCRK